MFTTMPKGQPTTGTAQRRKEPTAGAEQQKSAQVQLFQAVCVAEGLPRPVPEFKFDDGSWRPPGTKQRRRWLFDLAFPEQRVAVEIEGGVFMHDGKGGRHTRGVGFLDDMEKYNEATAQGWRVLRVTPARTTYRSNGKSKVAPYLFGAVFLSSLRRALESAGYSPRKTP